MRLMRIVGLAVCACLSGCTLGSSSVTNRAVLRAPPVSPEGTWRNLESMVRANKPDRVHRLFSRRYLISVLALRDEKIAYEKDYEDYEGQLERLDIELRQNQSAVTGFGQEVIGRLRPMLSTGVFVTAKPGYNMIYRDRRGVARGPNTGSVRLTYWTQSPGIGEPEHYNVIFVQEYEFWRVDGMWEEISERDPLSGR